MSQKYLKTIADIIQDHKNREQELLQRSLPSFDTTTCDDKEWDEIYKPSKERQKDYVSKKQR